MKPKTKIFLALSMIALCLLCVIVSFSQKSVVLVIYNPITNVTKQRNIKSGDSLEKYLVGADYQGYKFLGYYYSGDFIHAVDKSKSITQNTTVVMGYSKDITDISQATNEVVGVNFIGNLNSQELKTLLKKNYKYLDLSQANLSGEFEANNSELETLYLPAGEISGINNYSTLQKVYSIKPITLTNAFNNCENLKFVNIDNCSAIENSFNKCEKLTQFNIPENLTTMSNSFVDTHLKDITNKSPFFSLKGGVLYCEEEGQLTAKKALANLSETSILGETSKIDKHAFYNHKNIKSITINAKVSLIESHAFASSSLQSLNIVQNTVLTIGEKAFSNCQMLSNITFGKGIETIGAFAFYNTAIQTLSLENSVVSKLEQYSFSECDNLKEVKLENRQIVVERGVFSGCENLTTIENLNTKEISEKMFENCGKLTTLTNFYGVQNVQNYAFLNCTSLKDISELSSIKSAGIGSFENCLSIVEAKFLELEILPQNIFLNCSSLKEFVSTQEIKTFEASAFDGCENLENLVIVGSSYICDNGVVYNFSKTQLLFYLPTKADEIFTIPSTVESVQAKYLSQNKNLQSIEVDGDKFFAQDGVLFSSNKETLIAYPSGKQASSYRVPTFVKSILTLAFVKCPNLTSLTIGDNIQTLENGFLNQISNLITLNVCFVGENINKPQTGFLGWFFGAREYSQNNQFVPQSLKTVNVSEQEIFEEGCFYDCVNLLTVTLTNCGQASNNMFYGCYLLQTISLGKPLCSIGEYAFYNCKNMIQLDLVYNPLLTSADVKISALYNTPKGVRVNLYNDPQVDSTQLSEFSGCFKDKQYNWNWRTLKLPIK